jgi:ABC-type spermidine/putrescine transport system permease subunit II
MSGLPATARAFATYSLVPYLGILFCPGAVLLGTLGVVRSYRSQQISSESGRGACYASMIVGLVVLAVQLLLWWILYQAPRWTNEL